MYEYGGLWIGVWHPFATGRLVRWRKVVEFIEYMQSKGDVWFATMGEINDHVRQCMADGSWSPRVDVLPYDESPVIEHPGLDSRVPPIYHYFNRESSQAQIESRD